MTRQEYLDQNPTTNEIAVTQNILQNYTKTSAITLQRALRLLMHEALYKTQYRALSFEEVAKCVDEAVGMITHENTTNETVDNTSTIRRRGNR